MEVKKRVKYGSLPWSNHFSPLKFKIVFEKAIIIEELK